MANACSVTAPPSTPWRRCDPRYSPVWQPRRRKGRSPLSSGEASARLVQDVNAIETAFVRRSAPWAAAAAAGAAGAVIALASPWATVAFLLGLGLQIAVGETLGDRLTRTAGRDQLRASGRLKDGLGAYLQAAPELRCFNLTAKAVDALMVHDASLGRAALTRNDAEALLGLLQACLVAMTLTAVSALASSAALPLLALSVLAALAGMEGASGLLRAAQQQGAYREAVSRLDSVLVAPVAGAVRRRHGHPSSRSVDGIWPGRAACHHGAVRLRQDHSAGIAGRPAHCAAGTDPVRRPTLGGGTSGLGPVPFAHAPQDCRPPTGSIADNLRLADQTADEAAMWAGPRGGPTRRAAARTSAGPGDLDRRRRRGPVGRRAATAVVGSRLSEAGPWLLLDAADRRS